MRNEESANRFDDSSGSPLLRARKSREFLNQF